MFGSDIQLMFRPAPTYRVLVQSAFEANGLTVLRRPMLIATVIGAGVVLGATGTATFGSVLPMMAWWSFVPALQLLAATALVFSARSLGMSRARAIDLLLAGHAPWTLWVLVVTGMLGVGLFNNTIQNVFYGSVLLVLAWRAWLLYHFCRVVLNDGPRRALVRTAAHQCFIWAIVLGYVCYAVALEARF